MKIIASSYEKNNGIRIIDTITNVLIDSLNYYSPSFFVKYNDYIYTFSIEEKVYLKSIKIENNKLIEVDSFAIPGTSVTHLCFSEKNSLLFGCSYADGTFFSVKVNNGYYEKLITYQHHQVNSKCHCVFLNKDETTLAVINISLDKIYLYKINEEFKNTLVLNLPKGSGPRHGIYNEDSSLMYIVTEYSNEVIVIDMNSQEIKQIISTIPFSKNESFASTLLWTSDYKRLFVSNRGENNIAKFELNKSLEYAGSFSCNGDHPRHMIITKDDKYILSCNKNSGSISIINLQSEKEKNNISFPNVSCVHVLEL